MERFDIKYLGTVLTIVNVDDYNIKGTFNPNAESDIEFFGYRETSFDIVGGSLTHNGVTIQLDEVQLDYYRKDCNNTITYLVQGFLDSVEIEYEL